MNIRIAAWAHRKPGFPSNRAKLPRPRPLGAERQRRQLRAWCLALVAGLTALGLAGCGVSNQEIATSPGAAIPGRTIHGHVHGGVYPIRGATIKLMQTVTIAGNTPTAPGATTYVTPGNAYGAAAVVLQTTSSDANGIFTFSDNTWTCAPGEYAYIVVTGGHSANLDSGTTTAATNSNVVQVGVIGSCSADLASTAEIDTVNVFVSELSTVAAAAALGNFMSVTDPNDGTGDQVVNIGTPLKNLSTGACSTANGCTGAGLAHAFANAAVLVDSVRTNGTSPTGMANTGNAATYLVVPTALLNTMGDILQECVDSAGVATSSSSVTTASSLCQTLFQNATVPGLAAPTNTLQVALNMVQYPSTNVAKLFGSTAPTVPFNPSLAKAPGSFAVSIFYGVSYTGNNGSSIIPTPLALALDQNDGAYVLYTVKNMAGAPTGAGVATLAAGGILTPGTLNTTYLNPAQIGIDFTGLVYVTNNNTANMANDVLMRLSGTTLYPVVSLNGASGLAFDSSNDVFASSISTTTAAVSEYTQASMNTALLASMGSGGVTVPFTAATSSSAVGGAISLAIDGSQNVWGVGLSGNVAAALLWPKSSSQTAPYTSGGGSATAFTEAAPYGVAINSSGKAFFPVKAAVASATYISSIFNVNSSEAVSGNSGESAVANSIVPFGAEVDGAGNVFWTDNEQAGLVYKYIPGNGNTAGAVSGFLPCYTVPSGSSYVCLTNNPGDVTLAANFRGMAIDSAGDLWYVANSGNGALVETLGVAAPTWPLLSYGHPGVKPQ